MKERLCAFIIVAASAFLIGCGEGVQPVDSRVQETLDTVEKNEEQSVSEETVEETDKVDKAESTETEEEATVVLDEGITEIHSGLDARASMVSSVEPYNEGYLLQGKITINDMPITISEQEYNTMSLGSQFPAFEGKDWGQYVCIDDSDGHRFIDSYYTNDLEHYPGNYPVLWVTDEHKVEGGIQVYSGIGNETPNNRDFLELNYYPQFGQVILQDGKVYISGDAIITYYEDIDMTSAMSMKDYYDAGAPSYYKDIWGESWSGYIYELFGDDNGVVTRIMSIMEAG